MLSDFLTELLIILALTLANGLFSGSEIAIVSARRNRLETEALAGSRGAQQALELSKHPDRFLATVQVGITLIGTFSAAFGGARIGDILTVWLAQIPVLAEYAETVSLGLVVIILTYLSLVIGELVPKQIALQHAERFAAAAAPIMNVLAGVTRPLITFLSLSVKLVLRLLGQQELPESQVTPEDIVYMVREGTESGSVEAGEAQMIQRVFKFTNRPVKLVMTPRSEIVSLDIHTPLIKIAETFIESGYSRLPMFENSIENVVGFLHAKDLMRYLAQPGTQINMHHLLRPVMVVFRNDHTDDVLNLFRRKAAHMALVVDEYGQTAGLVTLEDLLEELVGEIQDEYDEGEEQPIVRREDGSWLVNGLEAYDKVKDRIGLPTVAGLDEEDFTTLAGLILSLHKRIPKVGDKVILGEYSLEVVDMDGRRIDKVLIYQQGKRPG